MCSDTAHARVLRAVEFYCGLGGLHWSLQRARLGCDAVVVAAYDVNPLACDTYAHNFRLRPSGRDIRALTPQELDAHAAHLWLLSPPCQPYTRNGLQKDKEDGRAGSFTALLAALQGMQRPPDRLLLENVVGFDTSAMRADVLAALAGRYVVHEFVVSPTQVGVPISRPRYFLLAARLPVSNACRLATPLPATPYPHPPPVPSYGGTDGDVSGHMDAPAHHAPLSHYLEELSPKEQMQHAVPWSAVRSSLLAVDFVHPDTRLPDAANCVTKAYGRYAKGAGSLLIASPDAVTHLFDAVRRDAAANAAAAGVELPLVAEGGKGGALGPFIAQHVHDWPADAPAVRYLTPTEIARLHGLPAEFSFPPHVTQLQRYALLGNSLSVDVVACLLEHLLHDWTGDAAM